MTQEQLEEKVRDLEQQVGILRQRVDKLEVLISGDANEIRISCGESSIRVTALEVQIRTGNAEVAATRSLILKASGNLVLKGNKIVEN
jgi:hypothetical protein